MNKTIYELTKLYGDGKGESTMWDTVRVISAAVEEHMAVEDRDHLKMAVYEMMSGEHFDEFFAKEAVNRMFYIDNDGKQHNGPYWTDDVIRGIYDKVKSQIRSYNYWDFYVTLNMIASDNHGLVKDWFPNEDPQDLDKRFVQLAINWLNDPDTKHPNSKIWCYLNK